MKRTIWYIIMSLLPVIYFSSCAEKSGDEPKNEENKEENNVKPSKDGTVVTSGYVDLGLSVKWAACNLGTDKCFELGESYQWGDLSTDCLENICGTEYDQATQELGSGWQLPSRNQMQELIDKCRFTFTTYRGIEGYVVTGTNGNAIFLPQEQGYIRCYFTGTCNLTTNGAYSLELNFFYSDHGNCQFLNGYYYNYELVSEDRKSYNYIRPVYVRK